jgi:hypothetical protein
MMHPSWRKLVLAIALFALLQASSASAIVVDISGTDPVGDTLQPGDYFDITSLTTLVTPEKVVFYLGFAVPISRTDEFNSNYPVGFIDLDVDRNVGTGLSPSNLELFAKQADPGLDFSGIAFGTDVYVDLFGFGPAIVDVVDVVLGNVGSADISVDASSRLLTVSIDQVQSGAEVFGRILTAGDFHFGAIVGPIPSPADDLSDDLGNCLAMQGPACVVPEPTSMVHCGLALMLGICARRRIARRVTLSARSAV